MTVETSGIWMVVKTLGSLGIVIAMIIGLSALIKRYAPHLQMRGSRKGRLEVLESLTLNTKVKVLLLRADDQTLVLGVGSDSVQNLTAPKNRDLDSFSITEVEGNQHVQTH